MKTRYLLNKVKNIKITFLVLMLSSCQNKDDILLKKLEGQWAIDKIEYKEINYINNLYSNAFFIEQNSIISLPKTFDFEKEYGNWNIINKSNNIEIKISSKNEIFNGIYSVKFIKNYNKKLLGIELKSKSTSIKAFKFLQDFELDGKNWE